MSNTISNGDYEDDLRTLQRIIALLLSLANLADRAAGRSICLSAIIVWILRPAETVVSRYLGLPSASICLRSGDACVNAARLARRLRVLADAIMQEAEMALGLSKAVRTRAIKALLVRLATCAQFRRVLGTASRAPYQDTS